MLLHPAKTQSIVITIVVFFPRSRRFVLINWTIRFLINLLNRFCSKANTPYTLASKVTRAFSRNFCWNNLLIIRAELLLVLNFTCTLNRFRYWKSLLAFKFERTVQCRCSSENGFSLGVNGFCCDRSSGFFFQYVQTLWSCFLHFNGTTGEQRKSCEQWPVVLFLVTFPVFIYFVFFTMTLSKSFASKPNRKFVSL